VTLEGIICLLHTRRFSTTSEIKTNSFLIRTHTYVQLLTAPFPLAIIYPFCICPVNGFGSSHFDISALVRLVTHLSLLVIGMRLKPSSTSANAGNLAPVMFDSPPSSPKRNAALSRFGPDVGFLPDFRNGEDEFGAEGLSGESVGSSIQEKEELAIVERVGTGARGRASVSDLR